MSTLVLLLFLLLSQVDCQLKLVALPPSLPPKLMACEPADSQPESETSEGRRQMGSEEVQG